MDKRFTIDREERLEALFDEYSLSVLFLDYVEDHNPSLRLPYHGWDHLLSVSYWAGKGGEYHGLSQHIIQSLMIAGLFHDTDYIPGATEERNIQASVDFMRKSTLVDDEKLVEMLIRATYFPHEKPLTLPSAIIQDADLLQRLELDYDEFRQGLNQEKGGRGVDPEFPPIEMLNTEWAKNLYKKSF